jgi:hypothetical protein
MFMTLDIFTEKGAPFWQESILIRKSYLVLFILSLGTIQVLRQHVFDLF